MSKPLPPRPDQGYGDKSKSPPAAQAPPAKAAAKPSKVKPPKKPSPWPWGPWRRALVSLLVAFHVLAVFSAPWFIQLSDVFEPALPPGRVPRDAQGRVIPLQDLDPRQYPPLRAIVPEALASRVSKFPLIWHYANLLYINNGYDFFSPDPSVNHLIRYEVFDAAGQPIVKGEFPNRREQWPRLLYHRYMMLVDQSSDPRNLRSGWEVRIANRLLTEYNGTRVHLTMVRHHLLSPEEVLAGRRLNEDSTYEVLNEMDQYRSDPSSSGAGGAPSGGAPAAGSAPGVRIPGGAR